MITTWYLAHRMRRNSCQDLAIIDPVVCCTPLFSLFCPSCILTRRLFLPARGILFLPLACHTPPKTVMMGGFVQSIPRVISSMHCEEPSSLFVWDTVQ